MAEARSPTEEKSDQEADTFEDALDTTPRPPPRDRARSKSPASVRSLTGRSASRSSVRRMDEQRQSTGTPTVPEETSVADDEAARPGALDRAGDGQANGVHPGEHEEAPLSARSTGEGELDDVNLEEDASQQPSHSRSSTLTPVQPPRPQSNPSPPQEPSSSMQGLSGTFQNHFPPPPKAPPKAHAPPPEKVPPPSRKLTSPFSWLSRGTTGDKKSPPPPPPRSASHERKDTRSSGITLASNSTDNGAKGEDSRATLQDRFKMLRMQGEAGLEDDGASISSGTNGGAIAGLVGRSATIGIGVSSPSVEHEEASSLKSPGVTSPDGPAPKRRPSMINPKLPPGTAAGVEAAPDTSGPVDWDLWQSVVCEGPAAVARTSETELKDAIGSGIPHAIRGVVWQVLADSKNEELEKVYKELVARGAHKPDANGTREKESVASSASSVHSVQSTPVLGSEAHESKPEAAAHSNGTNGVAADGPLMRMIQDARAKPSVDTKAIEKLEKVIKRDMGARTSYSKYLMSAGLQDGLFGICKSYALLDESVGYAQGMNFIAMPLLFNMPEEEAFSLFVTLMHSPKYRLRTLFTPDMSGLHLLLYQFSRCLEELDPVLYCHLHRRGVEPRLYATQWFLTLFAYRFPLQLVLRVYDFVLSEGLEGAMLRFALTLVEKNRDALLGMADMAQLTTFLKEKLFDVYIDRSPSASSLLESGFFGSAGGADKEVYKADALVSDAVAVQVREDMLRACEAEWTEQTRLEKERESELESLRSSVTTLTAKVRRLEESAEKSDTEHVSIASELVRTKVESEGVRDENESLRGQVEELRRVVQSQTEEVEARLRAEMESVMRRNVEIFGENRRLEEELGEMEKVLVGTKMELAQLNSEHDQLKQKWNNIAGMMKEHK